MQDTGPILNIQEMTHMLLVKIFLVIHIICIYIDINLLKTVADNVRKCRNGVYWDWLFAKHSWMVVTVQSYNLLNKYQRSNYLQIIWDYILFLLPIYKYGRNGAKKKCVLFKHCHQEIQKVNFVRKKENKNKIWLNTTLNISKMQNIFSKI